MAWQQPLVASHKASLGFSQRQGVQAADGRRQAVRSAREGSHWVPPHTHTRSLSCAVGGLVFFSAHCLATVKIMDRIIVKDRFYDSSESCSDRSGHSLRGKWGPEIIIPRSPSHAVFFFFLYSGGGESLSGIPGQAWLVFDL